MSLKRQTVRVIVSEPWDWNKIIFGTILSDSAGCDKMIIELTQPIKGKVMTSNLMELHPRHEKQTFKSLSQYYSVTVNGALVKENSNMSEFIIIGTVTLV
jgi:hypothetical protein